MLTKRIIPCLDVDRGRVVKCINYLNPQDAGDPVKAAQRYDEDGADELVFLDITASHEERDIILEVVRKTAEQVFMPLTVGGGIRTTEDIRKLLSAGADKVGITTAAVLNPQIVREGAERFGSQCIVVGMDPKRVNGRFELFTHGGRKATGIEAIGWAQEMEELGAGEILLNSIDRDGTKLGYDLELTRGVSDALSIPVIASSGVGNLEHLYEGIVEGHADAVLAASIFHYKEYTVRQAKEYLRDRGVPVRL